MVKTRRIYYYMFREKRYFYFDGKLLSLSKNDTNHLSFDELKDIQIYWVGECKKVMKKIGG